MKRLGEGKYLSRVCDLFSGSSAAEGEGEGEEEDPTPSQAIHRLCVARDNGDIVSFQLQGSAWFVRWRGAGELYPLTASSSSSTAATMRFPGMRNEIEDLVDELKRQADELELASVDKINSLYHLMRVGLEDFHAPGRGSAKEKNNNNIKRMRMEDGSEDCDSSSNKDDEDDGEDEKDEKDPHPTTTRLHALISLYFEKGTLREEPGFLPVPFEAMDDYARKTISMDVETLLDDSQFGDLPTHLRTSRALARIFHGVGSVRFTYEEWSMHPLWGRHARFDFEEVKAVAQAALAKKRKG